MATIVNRPKPSASAMRAGQFSLAARHCMATEALPELTHT